MEVKFYTFSKKSQVQFSSDYVFKQFDEIYTGEIQSLFRSQPRFKDLLTIALKKKISAVDFRK